MLLKLNVIFNSYFTRHNQIVNKFLLFNCAIGCSQLFIIMKKYIIIKFQI